MFSIYEGIHKWTAPEALNWPWLAVGVLVFGLAVEGMSLRGCLQEVNKVRGNRSIWRWFRESRSSELLVIFGEDSAAMLGLTMALVAILATMLTGNLLFDALGTVAIGVLLVVVAVLIAVEVKALLIGQGVESLRREQMLAFLCERPEIDEVFNLLTLHMGPEVMVAIKARMAPCPSANAMIEAINTVEHDFRARFEEVRWSFFEPDIAD